MGIFDQSKFLQYIQIPRQSAYVAEAWSNSMVKDSVPLANLHSRLHQSANSLFPPV